MNAKERNDLKAISKIVFKRMNADELAETKKKIEAEMDEYRNDLKTRNAAEFGNGDFTMEFYTIRLAAIEEVLGEVA